MPVEIDIPEDSLTGFSDQARKRLKAAVVKYANDVIDETNRIEAGSSSANGPPEVTRANVDGAVFLLRHGLGRPKRALGLKLLRIAAAVLPLGVGIAYNDSLQKSPGYLVFFILLVAVTMLTVTLSTLKD